MSDQPPTLRPNPRRSSVNVARQICELIDDYEEDREDTWHMMPRAASWPTPNAFNDLEDY